MAALNTHYSLITSPSSKTYTSLRSLMYVGTEGLEGTELKLLNGMEGLGFNLDAEKIDVTSWGDLFKQYKPGRFDGTLSFNLKYLAGDEVVKFMTTKGMYEGKIVPFAVVVDALDENSPVWKGVFTITKASPSFGNGDAIAYSVECSLCSQLEQVQLPAFKEVLKDFDAAKKRMVVTAGD